MNNSILMKKIQNYVDKFIIYFYIFCILSSIYYIIENVANLDINTVNGFINFTIFLFGLVITTIIIFLVTTFNQIDNL